MTKERHILYSQILIFKYFLIIHKLHFECNSVSIVFSADEDRNALINIIKLVGIQDKGVYNNLRTKHRLFMVMEVPNNLYPIGLHVYRGYTTCFLAIGTDPLLRTTLQPGFEHICVAFVQYLVTLLSWDALNEILTWKL